MKWAGTRNMWFFFIWPYSVSREGRERKKEWTEWTNQISTLFTAFKRPTNCSSRLPYQILVAFCFVA